MKRPAALLLLAPLLLAACTTRQPGPDVSGWGDPFTLGAQDALEDFGHTAGMEGRLDKSLFAALRVEQLAEAAQTDPLWQTGRISTLQPQLLMARRQMRQAAGIAEAAPPRPVQAGLYRALRAAQAGDMAQAQAALSGPAFPLGGAATLQRLQHLPRLPLVDQAAARTALIAGSPGPSSNSGLPF
ncbi:Hypothetical protein HVPorG_02824 [Roseomonas mucosa]|uniref:Lipoprotein n=1 Tax=Roseomonas mucosa TaxID=207340 RepID=A0A1S8D771_9PROT|nr:MULTISPECIES: hypothetical protein [Roseomonas]ATR20015.1 hypothetical protein CTJ15_06650 [Roseomonas sp. FDAARGOS_362]ONH83205.1 hypothetical protein APZ41_010610 [Roseomonas mucosa]QDJ10467.1 Hypothetical protein HVPorG_02824 [Roseomonas mucosa]USQ71936.1 hypothetical protein NF552_01445 [Roseomonas mucosa]UZO97806.1 Hypothetical protein RMHFA_02824 [Roseomonas mucosa]